MLIPATQTTTAKKTNPAAGKPKKASTNPATLLGLRPGTAVHKAVTMYMRPQGATGVQIAAACNGPQLNVLTRLQAQGHSVTKASVAGPNGRKVTAYRLVLKGNAKVGKGAKAHKRAAAASTTKNKARAKGTRAATKPATAAK